MSLLEAITTDFKHVVAISVVIGCLGAVVMNSALAKIFESLPAALHSHSFFQLYDKCPHPLLLFALVILSYGVLVAVAVIEHILFTILSTLFGFIAFKR
jgi:hypothetical protein